MLSMHSAAPRGAAPRARLPALLRQCSEQGLRARACPVYLSFNAKLLHCGCQTRNTPHGSLPAILQATDVGLDSHPADGCLPLQHFMKVHIAIVYHVGSVFLVPYISGSYKLN
jgi:hypothetical protein